MRRPILMHRFPDPALQSLPAEERRRAQNVLDRLEEAQKRGRYKAAIKEAINDFLGQRLDAAMCAQIVEAIKHRLARELQLHPSELEGVVNVAVQPHPLDPNRLDLKVQVNEVCYDGRIDLPPRLDF